MQRKFDNTKITVEFDEAGNRQQLSSGDSLKTLFGKIKKWFSDLKPVAFSGDYNDLENKPEKFSPETHTHDERYYTEEETDNKFVSDSKYYAINATARAGTNSGDSAYCKANPWYKVAECETNANHDENNMVLLVSQEQYMYDSKDDSYTGILNVVSKTSNNHKKGVAQLSWLCIDNKNNNTKQEWVLLYNDEGDACKFELWLKSENPWRNVSIRVLSSSAAYVFGAKWKLLDSFNNGQPNYTEGMTVVNVTYPSTDTIKGNISYEGTNRTGDIIKFIDNTSDTYGNGISIGDGGLTIIGGGESSNVIAEQYDPNHMEDGKMHGGDEKMIIANDAAIDFYTDCQNGFDTAKHISMSNGNVTANQFIGNATSASKLQTSRNISLGGNFVGSANFDGSGNITINARNEYAWCMSENTINYPYHRFAYIEPNSRKEYLDNGNIFIINRPYYDDKGGMGIFQVFIRKNNNTNSLFDIRWIVRDKNIPINCIKMCCNNDTNNTTVDLFYQFTKGYDGCVISRISDWGRRHTDEIPLKLCHSHESGNTTATDKKDSYESYKSLDDAATELGRTFTDILTPGSNSFIQESWFATKLNSDYITANSDLNTYIQSGIYYNGLNAEAKTLTNCPTQNAFVMFVKQYGDKNTGTQEITEYLTTNPKKYMRNFYNGTWGEWYRVYTTADPPTTTNVDWSNVQNKPTIPTKTSQLTNDSNFVTTSGNVASATKLATTRTINGTSFNGTGNITTSKWGTARTITIGNCSKSVDGSGNVTFSLSDIGALYNNCSSDGAITINGIKFYTIMNGSTFKVVDAENICCSNGYLKVVNSTGGYNGIYASQFSTQSSRRVKTNITPMTEDEARKILDVDVVGYDYINGAKDQYGMIAEDVYNVIPSIVSGNVDCDDDDTEAVMNIGIDYSKAVPYLIKMVQMMEVEIRELKKELKMRDKIDE